MGITGVEGVFRRCSEETLKVLRARHDELLTILEVLLYDPLYRWALDPLKALRLQRDDTDVDAELEDVAPVNHHHQNPPTGMVGWLGFSYFFFGFLVKSIRTAGCSVLPLFHLFLFIYPFFFF